MGSPTRNTALASTFVANGSQFGARVVISPFVPAIALTYGASKATIGGVLTLMWAVFALVHYPGGVFADRYGPSRVIRIALGLTALGSLLVTTAPTLATFMLGCVILGLGGGAYFPTGHAYLSGLFGDRSRGQALSVHAAAGTVAGVFFPTIATTIAHRFDWRAGIAVGTVAVVLATGVVVLSLRGSSLGSPTIAVRDRLSPSALIGLLTRPAVVTTIALGSVLMYLFQGFVSFYPTFLREYHGIAPQRASLLFSTAFLVVAFGLPLIGRLADRARTERVLLLPFGTMAVAIAIMLSVTAPWSTFLGTGLVGLGLSGGGAIAKRAMAHFDSTTHGTGFGIVRMLYVLLGSLANVVTGTLAQYWGWSYAYGVLGVLSLLAVGLLVLLVTVDPPALGVE